MFHKRLDAAVGADRQCLHRIGTARKQDAVEQIAHGRGLAGQKAGDGGVRFDEPVPHPVFDQNFLIEIGERLDRKHRGHDLGHTGGIHFFLGSCLIEELGIFRIENTDVVAGHRGKVFFAVRSLFRADGRKGHRQGKEQGSCLGNAHGRIIH